MRVGYATSGFVFDADDFYLMLSNLVYPKLV